MTEPASAEAREFKGRDAHALSVAKREFEQVRGDQDSYRRLWNDNYDRWRLKLRLPTTAAANHFRSRATVPTVHGFIEQMVPFFYEALFDDHQFISGWAHREQEVEEARTIGQIHNYNYIYPMEYGTKVLPKTLRGSLLYGTAWELYQPFFASQVDVQSKKVSKEDQEKIDAGELDPPVQTPRGVRWPYYKGAKATSVSTYDVFPDRAFQEVDQMRSLYHREITSMGELFDREFNEDGTPFLKNLKELAQTSMPGDAADDVGERIEAQSKEGHSNPLDDHTERDRTDRLAELIYRWTDTWLIIMGNRAVVIYNGPLPAPFKEIPLVATRPTQDPESFYGMAVTEVMKTLSKIIDIILNQHLDNNNKRINPPFLLRRAGNILTSQLTLAPGSYIHQNNQGDVERLEIPDSTANAFTNIGQLTAMLSEGTGVQDFFRGIQPDTSRFPATGINLLMQATTGRLKLMTKMMNGSIMKGVAMSHEIAKEMIDEDVVARYAGPQGLKFPTIGKDKFKSTYLDLITTGKASSLNPDFIVSQMLQLFPLLQNDPLTDPLSLRYALWSLMSLPNAVNMMRPDKLKEFEAQQRAQGAQGGAPGAAAGGPAPPPAPGIPDVQAGPEIVVPPSPTNPGGPRVATPASTIPVPQ